MNQANRRKGRASSGADPRGGVSTPLPIPSDTRSMRVLASSRPTAQKKRADSHRLLGYCDLPVTRRRFSSISHSIRSRAFSARHRDSSICSGVMTFTPGRLYRARSAAMIQLRSVFSNSPNDRGILNISFRPLATYSCLATLRGNRRFIMGRYFCCYWNPLASSLPLPCAAPSMQLAR